MFNVRPNLRVPGFNVREPEEEVPGFRLNADGTIGKPPMTAARPDGNPFDIFEPNEAALDAGSMSMACRSLQEATPRSLPEIPGMPESPTFAGNAVAPSDVLDLHGLDLLFAGAERRREI